MEDLGDYQRCKTYEFCFRKITNKKPSGGVSNFSEFIQMIEAGATRVGTSNAIKNFKKE